MKVFSLTLGILAWTLAAIGYWRSSHAVAQHWATGCDYCWHWQHLTTWANRWATVWLITTLCLVLDALLVT